MRIILHTHKDIQVKEGRFIERQSASDKERELERDLSGRGLGLAIHAGQVGSASPAGDVVPSVRCTHSKLTTDIYEEERVLKLLPHEISIESHGFKNESCADAGRKVRKEDM